MRRLFLPDCYVEQFHKINIDHLKKNHIKVLICDVDNTLAAHDTLEMDEVVRQFLRQVTEAGIQVAIVSNNRKKRVATYVGDNNYYFISNAKKPLPFAFRTIKKHFGVAYKQMAMLGDQLLTDILGGNALGVYTILTNPLVNRDINWTKINRQIERFVYWQLKKHYDFRKGVYYDK